MAVDNGVLRTFNRVSSQNRIASSPLRFSLPQPPHSPPRPNCLCHAFFHLWPAPPSY